jgi:hypothetical protein
MRPLLLLIGLLLATPMLAQTGGTVSSRFGIGGLSLHSTSAGDGMGRVAAPLHSATDINASNPAAWCAIEDLRLQGGASYEYASFSKSRSDFSNAYIEGFHFVFPIEERFRTRFSTGIMPVSTSTYHVIARGTTETGSDFTSHYRGDGGISVFHLGAAVRPLPYLEIGGAYQYYFGTIENSSEITFTDKTYYTTNQKVATSHTGGGALIGIMVLPTEQLTIGASIDLPVSLRAGRFSVLQYSTKDTTLTGAGGVQDIPLLLNAGVAWRLNQNWMVAADYMSQDWSSATVFDQTQPMLTRSYKIGAGVEWAPFNREAAAQFLGRVVLRAGFYTWRHYVATTSTPDTENMITAGFGFPVFANNRADIGMGFGWRGDEAQVLGSKNMVRLSIALSMGESWYVRKK